MWGRARRRGEPVQGWSARQGRDSAAAWPEDNRREKNEEEGRPRGLKQLIFGGQATENKHLFSAAVSVAVENKRLFSAAKS